MATEIEDNKLRSTFCILYMNFHTRLVLFRPVFVTFIIYRVESNSVPGVLPVNVKYYSSLYIRIILQYADPFSTVADPLKIP
jgi:hypothetical protein